MDNLAKRVRHGMTLIELLVVVAILAIIMLICTSIVASANKSFVSVQDAVRANVVIEGISRMMRNDMDKLSQSGYLYIGHPAPGASGRRDFFSLMSLGARTSTHPDGIGFVGQGCFVSYGLTTNTKTGKDEVLYRQMFVLGEPTTNTSTDDVWGQLGGSGSTEPLTISEIFEMTNAQVYTATGASDPTPASGLVKWVVDATPSKAGITVKVPAETKSELTGLGIVMSARIVNMTVEYGIIDTDGVKPVDLTKTTCGRFLWKEVDEGSCKVWTKADPTSTWPTLLKVTCELVDDTPVYDKWTSSKSYVIGNRVSYDRNNYQCIDDTTGTNPVTATNFWRPAGRTIQVILPVGTIPTTATYILP